jgi:peptidoglycan DL-endopeptidase CwlO
VPGFGWNERVPRWRMLLLIFITTLMVLSGPSIVQATTAAINKAQDEAEALVALIDQLNQELGAATEDYDYANQQLEDSQAKAKILTADLKQAEADLATVQGRLNQRVVGMYKTGNLGMLDVLMDANSFSELINRLEELAVIGRQDSKLVEEITAFKTKTADQKAQLEAELAQQQVYAEQTEIAKQKVLDQLAKQTKLLKGKEAQIAKLKKAEAERQARLIAEEKARQKFLASRPGKVISMAMDYAGVPYVWGGASPKGFDCSGLVLYCYAKVGIKLPHSSRMQYDCGKHVSRSEIKPGDLCFYYSPIQHVGIYIGNGRIINATGNHVQISDAFTRSYVGACRVL